MHLACHHAQHLELAMHWSFNEWQAVWFPAKKNQIFFWQRFCLKVWNTFNKASGMKLIVAKADGWSDGRTSEGSEMQLFACMLPVTIHHISCISEACTTSTCVDGSSTSCCKEVHWSANFIEWGEAPWVEMKQATSRFYCSKLKLH